MTQESLSNIVSKLLKQHQIPFDKEELTFQIQSHPSYPSIHAVTGVLDHFNIENVAANIPVESAALTHLPDSFMAQMESDLTVVTRKNTGFEIHGEGRSNEYMDEGAFLERFTGIIVAVEKGTEAGVETKRDVLTPFLWVLLGLLGIGLLFENSIPVPTLAVLALSVVGLAISITIQKQESGSKTLLGDAFCGDASEKKDCDAVLNSPGASVLGDYKVSDLSLIYFLTLTLGGFLVSLQTSQSEIIYYTTVLALPVTLYSLYYQWQVVKKWCMLCLSIVTVLWVQAGISLLLLDLNSPVIPNGLLLFSFIAIAVFSGWHYLKPVVQQVSEGKKTRMSYFKFKRNFSLFNALLKQANPISTKVSGTGEILFGNPHDGVEITIVTNPFCIHCKAVHKLVENIISRYSKQIAIKIRFNINLSDTNSSLVKIATRLLEIYREDSPESCMMAMGEIYGDSTVEKWLSKWGESSNPKQFLPILKEGKAWCTTMQINFTPEILINGRSYPRLYDRPDLIYFIEDLHEEALKVPKEDVEESLELAL